MAREGAGNAHALRMSRSARGADVGVAAALAEHAHVLMNGEVALSVPAADLLRNSDVLRSYLGR